MEGDLVATGHGCPKPVPITGTWIRERGSLSASLPVHLDRVPGLQDGVWNRSARNVLEVHPGWTLCRPTPSKGDAHRHVLSGGYSAGERDRLRERHALLVR